MRLAEFAGSIPVAFEEVAFEKPDPPALHLECTLHPAYTKDVTVDGSRQRETGVFKVNVWGPTGQGTGDVEGLAIEVVKAFPLVPKVGSVSIEETPQRGSVIKDVPGWLIVPVTISYRYES